MPPHLSTVCTAVRTIKPPSHAALLCYLYIYTRAATAGSAPLGLLGLLGQDPIQPCDQVQPFPIPRLLLRLLGVPSAGPLAAFEVREPRTLQLLANAHTRPRELGHHLQARAV